jgi:N-acetylglucosamine transport system substrate-binding protein
MVKGDEMSSSIERNTPGTGASRRRFLKQMGVAGVALGPGSAFLASCASGGDDGDEPEETSEPDDSTDDATEPADDMADNPLGIDPEGEVEIWIFDGGFTDAYAVNVHEPLLQEKWPNITINHNKAVDIAAELQTRFVGGNPPDFVNNSGDGLMDTAQLVADGQLADLTPLLDAPSWDDPNVKVRDLLVPGTIEKGTRGGVPVELNYAFTLFGLWINKTLFDEQGWTTQPQTWDEMMDLCAEIQDFGIAPWVYQGETAPRYMNWPILSMAIKQAGPEIMIPVDNLEEGAWKHEAILASAEAIYKLADAGYFMPGIEGMDFRDVQALWAQGEAAIVPSGSWLENEEADVIAEDETFSLAYMFEPLLDPSSAVLPVESLRASSSEPYIIPADAPHKEAGMEYMRAMISTAGAEGFSNEVSSLTSVQVEINIQNPGLASANDAKNAAGENTFNWDYPSWYPTMENPGIDQATRKLLLAESTPEQWADECESVAKSIREDDSIPKQSHDS